MKNGKNTVRLKNIVNSNKEYWKTSIYGISSFYLFIFDFN